jgi:glycosyltransferase involved in cell wall biosynthesis
MSSAEDRLLVSIVMTVYNGAAYLAEAIDSALAQSYRPLEVILVDDGSEDESDEVAASYVDVIRYEKRPHRGMGAARNRAVALARGDFLSFLDADDRFAVHKTELQMAAFDADPSLDVIFGHVREFISPDLDGPSSRRLRRPAERMPSRLPWALLIRRDAFFRVGLFSEMLKVGVGMDWCARAAERGLRATTLDDVVIERRLHADNNALRQRESRNHYVEVVKTALDRRRSAAQDP